MERLWWYLLPLLAAYHSQVDLESSLDQWSGPAADTKFKRILHAAQVGSVSNSVATVGAAVEALNSNDGNSNGLTGNTVPQTGGGGSLLTVDLLIELLRGILGSGGGTSGDNCRCWYCGPIGGTGGSEIDITVVVQILSNGGSNNNNWSCVCMDSWWSGTGSNSNTNLLSLRVLLRLLSTGNGGGSRNGFMYCRGTGVISPPGSGGGSGGGLLGVNLYVQLLNLLRLLVGVNLGGNGGGVIPGGGYGGGYGGGVIPGGGYGGGVIPGGGYGGGIGPGGGYGGGYGGGGKVPCNGPYGAGFGIPHPPHEGDCPCKHPGPYDAYHEDQDLDKHINLDLYQPDNPYDYVVNHVFNIFTYPSRRHKKVKVIKHVRSKPHGNYYPKHSEVDHPVLFATDQPKY